MDTNERETPDPREATTQRAIRLPVLSLLRTLPRTLPKLPLLRDRGTDDGGWGSVAGARQEVAFGSR